MTEGPKDILRRFIKARRDSTEGRESLITVLKLTRYGFFIGTISAISDVVWHFISGEYADPSRVVGAAFSRRFRHQARIPISLPQ